MSISENIKDFIVVAEYKDEVNSTLKKLEEFLKKYPLKANPEIIDALKVEDIFIRDSSQVGDFFKWIEYKLKKVGHLTVFSKVYKNASNQLEDFKFLLYKAVDDSKSLAEKVDAPWEKISGMGGDKHIAKKIIFCYNQGILPIFKTEHLEHFFNKLIGREKLPLNYDDYTTGQKYQFLIEELIRFKNSHLELKKWNHLYFSRFLYTKYPPPKIVISGKPSETKPLNELGLLFEPYYHDEVIFLFSKLHEKVGFPYIIRIQTEYPDIQAIDSERETKTLEIETYASQFSGHDPKDCDFIVCWENDLNEVPEDWPKIIQLKDYL